jgi:transposase
MRFMRDLSPETQRLLRRCDKESQHHRVRQRAHCILLSFGGKTTTELMQIFAVERLTIYHWFAAWEKRRFTGLSEHAKSGRPPKLTGAEQEHAQHYMAQHPQNMKRVVHLLEHETSQRVSTKTIKRLLKNIAMSGNGASTPQRRSQILRNMSAAKPDFLDARTVKGAERVMGGILMPPAFV